MPQPKTRGDQTRSSDIEQTLGRGIQVAQYGMVTNAALAVAKLLAGIVGHSYALVADAVESTADVFSSLIVWGGLRVASRDATEQYPFGFARAEQVAAAVVGLMLIGAAIGISVQAVREIQLPGDAPAPFTLVVLVVVIVIKEILFRYVLRANRDIGSLAIHADAWHHRSDAITSAAAFVGITLTLVGGPEWGSADGYAALVASLVIVVNGVRTLRPAVADLMDRAPAQDLVARVARTAESVSDVQAIEKVLIRKAGIGYFVDLHVQADPEMTLNEAHVLSGRVKSALREADSSMLGALIHMEPYEAADGAIPRARNS